MGISRHNLLCSSSESQCIYVLQHLLILNNAQNRIIEPGKLLEEIPNWFPDARLNYAENLLIRKDDGIALTEATEVGVVAEVSYKELNARVSQMASALRESGLKAGDRVAGESTLYPIPSNRANIRNYYQSHRDQLQRGSRLSACCCKHWRYIL